MFPCLYETHVLRCSFDVRCLQNSRTKADEKESQANAAPGLVRRERCSPATAHLPPSLFAPPPGTLRARSDVHRLPHLPHPLFSPAPRTTKGGGGRSRPVLAIEHIHPPDKQAGVFSATRRLTPVERKFSLINSGWKKSGISAVTPLISFVAERLSYFMQSQSSAISCRQLCKSLFFKHL